MVGGGTRGRGHSRARDNRVHDDSRGRHGHHVHRVRDCSHSPRVHCAREVHVDGESHHRAAENLVAHRKLHRPKLASGAHPKAGQQVALEDGASRSQVVGAVL